MGDNSDHSNPKLRRVCLSPTEAISTPFGLLTYLVETDTESGPALFFTAEVTKAVDEYRDIIKALKTLKKLSTPVRLVLLIFPVPSALSPKDSERIRMTGLAPAYAHTLESWIGDTSVNSVEEFLKNHHTNEEG